LCVREVNVYWMESLIASPNKLDIVFKHEKGKGNHFYQPMPNGGSKYMCAPHANCESHQRFFQKDTTTALFKTFIQLHPLRRGEMTTHNTVQQQRQTT